ncbi:hypothetical protein Pla52n_28780 [Stieleria varia]|uniref:Uncharacterized protein n=1 Tax=Stieleria varia TaxID=2528005 RepID=A0A5C6B307_9BACT|nr:hypothetical protein Pla52n_28780 [Stieleria varia]
MIVIASTIGAVSLRPQSLLQQAPAMPLDPRLQKLFFLGDLVVYQYPGSAKKWVRLGDAFGQTMLVLHNESSATRNPASKQVNPRKGNRP